MLRLPKLLPWQRTLWAAVIVQILSLLAFQAGYILIPYYIQDLGITEIAEVARWTGAYQSVGGVVMAVFTPIWGALGDRFGRKPNVVRATIGTAVMMAVTAFVQTPTQLLVVRALQGVVTGTPSACAVLVAASVPKKRIAFALGMLQTAFYVGISLGPMMGGWVSDAIGFRSTFLVSSAIVGVAVVVAVVMAKEPERDAPTEPLSELKPRSRNPLAGFRDLMRNPVLAGLIVVNLMLAISYSIMSPAMPIFIQQLIPEGASPASVAGTITGAGAVTAALAAMVVGQLSDRVGHRRTTVLGMIGTTILYVPMGLAQTPLFLGIMSAVQGLFRGGIGPSLSAMLVSSAPRDRTGAALGLNSSAASVGFAVGPMLGAAIVAGWSTRAAFFAAAGLFAAVCFVASAVGRRAEAAAVGE
jgi:DHA1 family multidrug resistance protein-like MFS transporter